MTQVVVWVMETAVVVQPLRKITEVLVVQTMAVLREERASNTTRFARNETLLRSGNETFLVSNTNDSSTPLGDVGGRRRTSLANNTAHSPLQLRGSSQASLRHAVNTALG